MDIHPKIRNGTEVLKLPSRLARDITNTAQSLLMKGANLEGLGSLIFWFVHGPKKYLGSLEPSFLCSRPIASIAQVLTARDNDDPNWLKEYDNSEIPH